MAVASWNRLAAVGDLLEHVVVNHEVRRIRAGEWHQYRELRLEALKDSPLAFVERYEDSITRSRQFWQDRVVHAATGHTSSIFVAVHGGRFIGKAGCFVETEITEFVSAHVVGVYVTPQWRGHDVAEELMAAILRWARE